MAPIGGIFLEIWYWEFWWKSAEKTQVWLNPDKNIGHFTFCCWLATKAFLRTSEFLYCWQRDVVQQYTENALLRAHCNTGCANAPHCYVIRTFPISFETFLDMASICNATQGKIFCHSFVLCLRSSKSSAYLQHEMTVRMHLFLPLSVEEGISNPFVYWSKDCSKDARSFGGR
jgi:hypothetical protein